MNRNKRRVVAFILICITFSTCFFSNKNVNRIHAAPAGNIYFCIDGLVPGSPEFKFYFDNEEKVLKVIDRKEGVFLPPDSEDEEFLKIKIYDFYGRVKGSVTLLGNDKGTSEKLNHLENIPIEFGDGLGIDSNFQEKIRIEGKLEDFKGFNGDLGVPKFILGKSGIGIIYVQEPVFSGVRNIVIPKGQKKFNPLEGISVKSPIQGDLTGEIEIEGSVDVNTCGEYILKYSVTDLFNTKVEASRKVIVKEPKKKPVGRQVFFNVYGDESEDIPEFKIAIDKDNKVINVVDKKDVNFLSNALKDKEYIGISLFNKSNKEKLSVSLLGSDKGNSSKLNVLDNYSYESGDYLRLKIKNDESINLTGDITGLRASYLRLEDLKFNLTEQGISVEDTNQNIPFTIEFKGDNKIPKGSIFNPLEGVNATNEYDEDYTDKIQVVGNVDTNTSGSYMLTYNVIYDGKKGNPVERIITVENVLTKEELEKLKNLKGIYPPLNLQNHRNFFRSIDRKINNFIIKFKDEGNDDIYKRRQKRG